MRNDTASQRSSELKKKQTLAAYAYEEISQALLSGRMRPGEKLTLRQLQATLNVSSTPIRDAIRQLSVENAIDFAPNRYIRVPTLKADQLRELRDIRVMLEGYAAEVAAKSITPTIFENLRSLDEQIRATRDTGDIVSAMDGIHRFHFAIYRETRMAHLINLIRGLWLRTAPYRSLLFPNYSRMERGSLRLMIIEALGKKDGASARILMHADITGAMDYIIGRIEQDQRNQASGVVE